MNRHWLITRPTYGTWLPGDRRGFVGTFTEPESDEKKIENIPGTPYTSGNDAMRHYAASQLKHNPIYLILEQAERLADQFEETAGYREWKLYAFAVMRNHVHIVVGVMGDPDPESILRDFKAYGSRKLNQQWGKPPSDTWWTESGSKRKLKGPRALRGAIEYVWNQENPLVVKVLCEMDACEEPGG